MTTVRAMVSGVGALIGYGIVRSLRHSSYPTHVVGIDVKPDAVGKIWCDELVIAPPSSSPEYPAFLRQLIVERRVDLVMPGFESDTLRLAELGSSLADLQVALVLNHQELLDTAQDKWLTHQALAREQLPLIPTRLDGSFDQLADELGSPFLVKPRCSHASQDVSLIGSATELGYWRDRLGANFMAQKIVGSAKDEYTAGVFGYADGTACQPIVMQRELGRDGATTSARVVQLSDLNQVIADLVAIFKPTGPTNFQFRASQGEYYLLEINPRISSTTSIRTAFGYNEAHMCIEYYLHGRRPTPGPVRSGAARRYLEDVVVYDCDHI